MQTQSLTKQRFLWIALAAAIAFALVLSGGALHGTQAQEVTELACYSRLAVEPYNNVDPFQLTATELIRTATEGAYIRQTMTPLALGINPTATGTPRPTGTPVALSAVYPTATALAQIMFEATQSAVLTPDSADMLAASPAMAQMAPQNPAGGTVSGQAANTLPQTGGGGGGGGGPIPTLEPPTPAPVPQDMFFENYGVNPFVETTQDNLSTFAMDVDTASYTLARTYLLQNGLLPPVDAIRPEEFINYFPTHYGQPQGNDAFAIQMDAAPSPFREDGTLLMRVGLQGRSVTPEQRDPVLLIFVVDVSGSMADNDRMGTVRDALRVLVGQLGADDYVGIVTFSDYAYRLLEPVPASEINSILSAIETLVPTNSTNAEAGLCYGYQMTLENQHLQRSTRVILLSDGVANVGLTQPGDIQDAIVGGTRQGITLTSIGVGMGNFNDVLMEQLADNGDGNYYYVDNVREARRVFVNNLVATLQVIAYDARIQVEFNPDVASRYRLIGYENRAIADAEFRADATVDAAEIGAGHTITALYEVEVNPQAQPDSAIATAFVRYEDAPSREVVEVNQTLTLTDVYAQFDNAPEDFRLLSAVAQFSELLRGSPFSAGSTYGDVIAILEGLTQQNPDVAELVQMVAAAEAYAGQ